MGFFSRYPYNDFNNLNLDWVILRLKEVEEALNTYIENSVITFADPITWDITDQYTALTIVIDSDGTAYLSKQPVPAGVDISNTNYWLPVFNYDDNINELRDQIAYNARESATTGEALTAGDLVFWQGVIYKVLVDMPAGTAFIEGTNIEAYTVDEKINDIAADITTIQGDITNIQGDITNIQGEIDLLNSEPVNILLLGAKNDGSEDVSDIINTYTSQYTLYAPAGIYRLDSPVVLENGLYGAGSERLTPQTTLFVSNFDTSADLFTGTNNANGKYELKHFTINAQGHAHGNIINASAGINKITDIAILNNTNTGVYCSPTVSSSRCIYINGLLVNAATGYYPTRGVIIGSLANDCMFTELELMACQIGMTLQGNSHRVSNCHIWCGTRMGSDDGTWFSNTRGITIYGVMDLLDNIEFDTAYIALTVMGGHSCTLSNASFMTDSTILPSRPSAYIEVRNGGHIDLTNIMTTFNTNALPVRLINDQNTSISGYTIRGLSMQNVPANADRELLPLLTGELADNSYHLKDNNTAFTEIACFNREASTGNVAFDVIMNAARARIRIQMSSSAITFCEIDTLGAGLPTLYYKVADNRLRIYAQTASELSITLRNSTNKYVAPINIGAIKGYTRDSTTVGLTTLANVP